MHLPVKPRNVLIAALFLLAVLLVAWTFYQFDQETSRSERHDYTYSIGFSCNTTIDNVTMVLPVPELNNTPFFTGPILNGTAYGVPPDWNVSLVRENGTPMLTIRSVRMSPGYHGYPVPIGPVVSVLPTTLRPGREYSAGTPVLIPVSITVMEPVMAEIETRSPAGREPVFFPGGRFSTGSGVPPAFNGPVYDHPVPVYISYTSDRPVSISLRISVEGSNAIWKGGWLSNTYSDTVIVEITDGTQGWVQGTGRLLTGAGTYY